jgi:hypothetical protein
VELHHSPPQPKRLSYFLTASKSEKEQSQRGIRFLGALGRAKTEAASLKNEQLPTVIAEEISPFSELNAMCEIASISLPDIWDFWAAHCRDICHIGARLRIALRLFKADLAPAKALGRNAVDAFLRIAFAPKYPPGYLLADEVSQEANGAPPRDAAPSEDETNLTERLKAATYEDILREAAADTLDQFLTDLYPMDYNNPDWRELLRKCEELVESGRLEAKFQEHYASKAPIFLDGPARITLLGQEHLAKSERESIEQGRSAKPQQVKLRSAKKRNRGRPVDTDRKDDKRIYEAWKTRQYKTYADCGQALGKPERETYLAIERHRARLKRGSRKRK